MDAKSSSAIRSYNVVRRYIVVEATRAHVAYMTQSIELRATLSIKVVIDIIKLLAAATITNMVLD